MRSTVNYELRRGRTKTYVGITNNPERRRKEHARSKDFDKMSVVGRRKTRTGALKAERAARATYKRNHRGQCPEDNKERGCPRASPWILLLGVIAVLSGLKVIDHWVKRR
jgi:predicted GIY-YIG superfamily endonuclease